LSTEVTREELEEAVTSSSLFLSVTPPPPSPASCCVFIWGRMQENKLPASDFNRTEEDTFLCVSLQRRLHAAFFSLYIRKMK